MPDQYANTGTADATYTDADGDVAIRTDSDDSHYFGADPSVHIDKTTADDYGNEADALGILPGEPVTWNCTVTNDGNVPLENVSVTDDQGVTVVCPQNTLAVGERMTCTASGLAAAGWYSNAGTAWGDYADDMGNSATVTDSDGSSYYGLTPGTVTDSALCDFGDQFCLIFTPDMPHFSPSTPFYKLSASNPGQSFYNVFYVSGGGTDTITLEIPYPFVTRGANPVHVYGGLTVDPVNSDSPSRDNPVNCFVPNNELASYRLPITPASYTDTNGDGVVGYGDVAPVDVPAELGFQYVNIHLDYGLEKTRDWEKAGADALNGGASDPSLAGVSINDDTAHVFNASADGILIPGSSDPDYNFNEFKQIRGFGGLVYLATAQDGAEPVHAPLAGARVRLSGYRNKAIETMTTDSDGWYLSQYVHRGKRTFYTLQLLDEGGNVIQSRRVVVGANVKFGEVSFVIEGPP